jgi:hypothetical protein
MKKRAGQPPARFFIATISGLNSATDAFLTAPPLL